MKKIPFSSYFPKKVVLKVFLCLFLLLNLFILTFSSSSSNMADSNLNNDTSAALSKSNLQFTFKLHKELTKGNSDNVFFSPFSISTALAMTFLGAREKTAEQMADALGISDMKDEVHQNFEKYLSIILKKYKNFTLHTANRLFPNHLSKVETDYINSCIKHYQADILPLDFSQGEVSRKIINDWVSKSTNDKIKDLIGSGILKPDVFMVLVNAIYFKGNWASQFDEKQTRKDRFHINLSEEVEVDMMYQKKKFSYTYNPQHLCSVLELPYKGDSLSMVFILPDMTDGLSAIEEAMNPDMFNELQSTLRNNSDVEVFIPKFKFLYQNLSWKRNLNCQQFCPNWECQTPSMKQKQIFRGWIKQRMFTFLK
ncbi:serpin B6-like [Mytilus edulis]|uniref:serpin B6-like n=1 Tax=Mytilus edulis TaxID=6550 RepID=UPI0039EFDD66